MYYDKKMTDINRLIFFTFSFCEDKTLVLHRVEK